MIDVKFCNKCGLVKPVEEFHKNKNSATGFQTYCKGCRNIVYHASDKSLKKKYDSTRYFDSREEHSVWRKKHYIDNISHYKSYYKEYYAKNKDFILLNNKKYAESKSEYGDFYNKLTIDESPMLSSDGKSLEVKCKYCSKYFKPTNSQVTSRVHSLNNLNSAANSFLYCSTGCKESCPVYKQHKYPKGFRKTSSREVDSSLRQMCFERDNWKCQICGKSVEEVILHCHHIEGYTQNPLLGNDLNNVITLCKEHHKEVHKLSGCTYHELRCTKEPI